MGLDVVVLDAGHPRSQCELAAARSLLPKLACGACGAAVGKGSGHQAQIACNCARALARHAQDAVQDERIELLHVLGEDHLRRQACVDGAGRLRDARAQGQPCEDGNER